MERTQLFAEVLEAVDQFASEEQETLMAIVQRRMAERGRKLPATDVQEARREFAEGFRHPSGADELMSEILS